VVNDCSQARSAVTPPTRPMVISYASKRDVRSITPPRSSTMKLCDSYIHRVPKK